MDIDRKTQSECQTLLSYNKLKGTSCNKLDKWRLPERSPAKISYFRSKNHPLAKLR